VFSDQADQLEKFHVITKAHRTGDEYLILPPFWKNYGNILTMGIMQKLFLSYLRLVIVKRAFAAFAIQIFIEFKRLPSSHIC